MLLKKERLAPDEFYTRGYKALKTPYFLLKARPYAGSRNRIGVVIGKSAVKTAVGRNFWKRQSKSILSALGSGKSHDFLISFSPQIKKITKSEFKKQLLKSVNSII